jgi:hypothetical protein
VTQLRELPQRRRLSLAQQAKSKTQTKQAAAKTEGSARRSRLQETALFTTVRLPQLRQAPKKVLQEAHR